MAFEDAVVLAKALRDFGSFDGLARYERLRRPRVEDNIEASAQMSTGTMPGACSARPRSATRNSPAISTGLVACRESPAAATEALS